MSDRDDIGLELTFYGELMVCASVQHAVEWERNLAGLP